MTPPRRRPSRRKIERDRQRMVDYVQMREDIRQELGRRDYEDGEELSATGVRSQGEPQYLKWFNFKLFL